MKRRKNHGGEGKYSLHEDDKFRIVLIPDNSKKEPPHLVPSTSVQERSPSPSFMEKIQILTGLTGAALITYIIMSEGSRLIPPRNLIPIP